MIQLRRACLTWIMCNVSFHLINSLVVPCSESVDVIQSCQVKGVDSMHIVFDIEPFIEVLDILHVDETEKCIEFFLSLMIRWKDENSKLINGTPGLSEWFEVKNDIKKPTLLFLNTKIINKSLVYGTDNFHYFWYNWDKNSKELGEKFEYVEHLQTKLFCNFNFQYFPFDEHVCQLKFYNPLYESTTFKPIHIFNQTKDVSTKVPFNITIKVLEEVEKMNILSYEYNVTGIEFKLVRKSPILLVFNYFIPTGMFGILSMISLIIKPEQVRTTLPKACPKAKAYLYIETDSKKNQNYV